MISVNSVTVSFGGHSLFENISFLINPKDRIGLAGKNGAGKSTLLKILSGLQAPTTGEVAMPKSCKIGYLPQDMIHQHGRSVFEETETAYEEIRELEDRIADINHQLETRSDYESAAYMALIEEQSHIYTRLDLLGVANMHEEIEKVLKGLGFTRKDFNRQTAEFSGGWRMRIELAKLLLQNPDVLLLDEPTNHLDIEAIMWLEDFMESFAGAVVLISHDKTFLDNVTRRTIEISNQKIYDYKTNYSRYLVLRKERKEQQESAARNQQKMIEHTEMLIDKYRAKANKASFAQSLIKKLDRIERVEVDEDDNQSMHFRFPAPAHSGKIVLTVEHAGKAFADKRIFSDANFIITKGEKIGLVGRNGEGKSTMMKMIAGRIPFDGQVKHGHSVLSGYFEQDQEEKLDPKKTVFETIDDLAVGEVRKQVRGLLGSFLFRGEDIDKKVQVLSGGERGRLALCKLLLEPYNLLLLDEPTNHLDIRSKDILKKALMDYEGTVIMVSHDRDFMKGICNRLFEFRDGQVKEHLCGIEEFMELRKVERLNELDLDKKPAEKTKTTEPKPKPVTSQVAEDSQKQVHKQLKKLEEKIGAMELEIRFMDEKLSDATEYAILMHDRHFFDNYNKMKTELEAEMKKWEELSAGLS
ncbi:MAG TPA: ABC-F family ATP-binding cassette domain-containing protein [Bacteroidia bacterium]|nr:ABC-F family ATP-binding cassette domain-containing protein [Bacteroidia bacterium]